MFTRPSQTSKKLTTHHHILEVDEPVDKTLGLDKGHAQCEAEQSTIELPLEPFVLHL